MFNPTPDNLIGAKAVNRPSELPSRFIPSQKQSHSGKFAALSETNISSASLTVVRD